MLVRVERCRRQSNSGMNTESSFEKLLREMGPNHLMDSCQCREARQEWVHWQGMEQSWGIKQGSTG
jgi:hypothetical protein